MLADRVQQWALEEAAVAGRRRAARDLEQATPLVDLSLPAVLLNPPPLLPPRPPERPRLATLAERAAAKSRALWAAELALRDAAALQRPRQVRIPAARGGGTLPRSAGSRASPHDRAVASALGLSYADGGYYHFAPESGGAVFERSSYGARGGSPHLGDEISPVTSLRLPRGSHRLQGPADRPGEYGDGEEARQLAAADDSWAARGLNFDVSV